MNFLTYTGHVLYGALVFFGVLIVIRAVLYTVVSTYYLAREDGRTGVKRNILMTLLNY